MTDPQVPASSRYKEIIATATGAAEKMREHEGEKAAQLAKEVASADERIAAAEQQRDEVADGAELRWNHAMEALWDERWMRVTPMPQPDHRAQPGRAADLIALMQSAYLGLRRSLEKSRWTPTLRRGKREQ